VSRVAGQINEFIGIMLQVMQEFVVPVVEIANVLE